MINRWEPSSEEQILDSIAAGTLRESHYLEVKQSANNSSIAATLASLAIDGGTFILGIEEVADAQKNKMLKPKPFITEGWPERIDQIARNSIEPPLTVRTAIISSAQEPSHGYAVVTVQPSPLAPHMAGGKYYGRGEASKHALGDAEVIRHHQARQQRSDLGAKLLQEEQERDYLPADQQTLGHIYIVAEPLMPTNEALLEDALENGLLYEIVTQGSHKAANVSPGPERASNKLARSRGTAFVSYEALGPGRTPNPEANANTVESKLLDVEVTHGGGLRVYLGQGTALWTPEQAVILDSLAVAYMQHLMAWMSRLAEALNYGGAWVVGIRATGLRGLKSSRSLEFGSGNRYGAMDSDTYQRVTTVTLAEVQDAPNATVRSIIGNYLRALGTEGHYSLDR